MVISPVGVIGVDENGLSEDFQQTFSTLRL
jgi:hypothetical protein